MKIWNSPEIEEVSQMLAVARAIVFFGAFAAVLIIGGFILHGCH